MAATARSPGRFRLLVSAVALTVVALVGVALLVLLALAVLLIPVWVGVPGVLGVTALIRGFTGRHWARAARLLGVAIDRPYRPVEQRGWIARLKGVAGDPATWRDLAWLLLNATAGTLLRLVPVALFAAALTFLAVPAIWQLLPADIDPVYLGVVRLTDQTSANLVGVEGLLVGLLWWWTTPPLLRADARLARWLLAPTERSRLASRVRQLAETRATRRPPSCAASSGTCTTASWPWRSATTARAAPTPATAAGCAASSAGWRPSMARSW